ncbi:MAG: hypothetical protein E6X17_04475 [Sporomusaceae bacterium]|nr:hypothetical protein [Sporomusaceae bacterium]
MASTAVKQPEADGRPGPPPAAVNKAALLKKWLKRVILLLLLVAVAAIALAAAAVRYQYVDSEQLDAWGIGQYPLAGRIVDALRPESPDAADAPAVAADAEQPAAPVTLPPIQPVLPQPVRQPRIPVDDTELQKQAALQQAAEQKRLTKVARLYGGMKPEAAVKIFDEMDDATVLLLFGKMEEERVAKILTLLEPERAARLSDAMLKGRSNG